LRELTSRVAVVTGAASGIGFALSERFASEGMKVVMADVERPALAEAAELLAGRGHQVLPVPTDVSDAAAMERLRGQVVDAFGAAHILCNNAGVAAPGAVWELSSSAWDWQIGVNLIGVVNGLRAFVPLLAEQDEAHIVNTASIAGLVAGVLGAYSVTKHGVVALSEALYFNLLQRGLGHVGVSVLCPGVVRTRIAEADRNLPAGVELPSPRPEEQAFAEILRQQIEQGTDPAEIAAQVLDSIRSGRFYVITHPEMLSGVEGRFQEILAGGPPTAPRG
jgi:NAD(P)-dependent dehydrogenase (short-subunit alcohol dehydrogenase family)